MNMWLYKVYNIKKKLYERKLSKLEVGNIYSMNSMNSERRDSCDCIDEQCNLAW